MYFICESNAKRQRESERNDGIAKRKILYDILLRSKDVTKFYLNIFLI